MWCRWKFLILHPSRPPWPPAAQNSWRPSAGERCEYHYYRTFWRWKFAVHQAKCYFDDNLPCCPFTLGQPDPFNLLLLSKNVANTIFQVCEAVYIKKSIHDVFWWKFHLCISWFHTFLQCLYEPANVDALKEELRRHMKPPRCKVYLVHRFGPLQTRDCWLRR